MGKLLNYLVYFCFCFCFHLFEYLSYQVFFSVQLLYIANKQYRGSNGTTQILQVNKSVPLTSTTTDYMLENLVPGTKYIIEIQVQLVSAGIGAPTRVEITTVILRMYSSLPLHRLSPKIHRFTKCYNFHRTNFDATEIINIC